jgi:hypothetical protein
MQISSRAPACAQTHARQTVSLTNVRTHSDFDCTRALSPQKNDDVIADQNKFFDTLLTWLQKSIKFLFVMTLRWREKSINKGVPAQ